MSKVLIVFVAGGIGCVVRYAITFVLPKPSEGFPWATLAANVTACLIIALGAYLLKNKLGDTGALALAGFCGGLSTFSAFSLETIELLNRGLVTTALLYVFTSLIFCFLTIWAVSRMA